MLERLALFLLWAAIGFATSLGLIYAFTPFGLAGLVLPLDARRPEWALLGSNQ